MDFSQVVNLRRMVRSFDATDVPREVVDQVVRAALRAPTAGNTGGTSWLVLQGADQTRQYWDATTDEAWRSANRDRWEGMRRAPVVLLAYFSAEAYVRRYQEPDKAGSALGSGEMSWKVPYWTGDAAFGVMSALFSAVDANVGACFLGNFRGEDELRGRLGVPPRWRLFGAVLLGYPDGADHRSASLDRDPTGAETRIHHGRWDDGTGNAARLDS